MKSESKKSVFEQPVRVSVNFDYSLTFTRDIFAIDNPAFIEATRGAQGASQLAVYIDDGVANAWPDIQAMIGQYVQHHKSCLSLLHDPMVILGGENGKTMATVEMLHRQMLSAGLDRQSYVVAIGGGAALDTMGYAASTFHRGIRLVRIPTTVLAQNDAGIGVKNGINAYGIKNLLGCFSPPFAVINDSQFLKTLSVRDRRAGIAEAVKVAAIRDKVFFEWLEANAMEFADADSVVMDILIRRCAELHLAQIVNGGDPFETGSARPLDYGHWSAHKIEVLSGYELNHGEAVAMGMALDALYACGAGLLAESEALRLVALLKNVGFTLWHPCLLDVTETGESSLLAGLEEFRQHLGGALCITLLTDIGYSIEVHEMDNQGVLQARAWLKALACN